MRDRLIEFIEFMEGHNTLTEEEMEALPKLELSFMMATPKDRVMLYLNAVEYLEPKRQRTSIKENDSELPEEFY